MPIAKNIRRSLFAAAALMIANPVLAAMLPPPAASVPTLGEWGLAGIAALLAVAAGRALRNRGR